MSDLPSGLRWILNAQADETALTRSVELDEARRRLALGLGSPKEYGEAKQRACIGLLKRSRNADRS